MIIVGILIKPLKEFGVSNSGSEYRVIEVLDGVKAIIEFQDEWRYRMEVYISNIRKGKLTNPFQRTIYNVGYYGVGSYVSRENGRIAVAYSVWEHMLRRCYDKDYQKTCQSYISCSVNNEWHNYQTFAKWWDHNYYEIPGEIMQLDKDILVRGNKIYGADKCCIIPEKLNHAVIIKSKNRNLPIGVRNGKNGNYYAQITDGDKHIHIGTFITKEDAFNAYKTHKEKLIKYYSDFYKEYIPSNVYEALYNWTINITN